MNASAPPVAASAFFLKEYYLTPTLLSDIFAGRKFCGSQKPRIFCIFTELNFVVHVLEKILREFNFLRHFNQEQLYKVKRKKWRK